MPRLLCLLAAWLVAFPSMHSLRGDEPLHRKIDALIEAGAPETDFAGPAGDAEFLRRVHLDLAGRIPSAAEARAFFDDHAPDKRTRLIDRLLAGPDYPRRMHELLNVMLMERRGENDEWSRFLRTAVRQNTPWDQLVRAILAPDADNEAARGAAYFFSARLVSEGAMAPVDVPGLTRDVGRLLAGVDLACAQCHDHLTIDDYKQADFQGLHMIFENVELRRDVQFPAVAQKLMTAEKEFMSVFTQTPRQTAPRAPGGGEIPIATFPDGQQYVTPPDRKTRTPGVPKFSPLGELAERLAAADNELFCRNIVNRLWFVMMGRGLVEPLDLQHSDNPPTHPELLDLLAAEFAAHQFDIRWLLRELALSDCYQRTSELPAGSPAPDWRTYAVAHEKRLSAEQLYWSTLLATGWLRPPAAEDLPSGQHEEKDDDDGERGEATADLTALERQAADSKSLAELQKRFLKTFANPPKEPEVDFEPSVKAALFLMHDQRLLALLEPKQDSLVARLSELSDDGAAAEMFLSVLSRRPSPEEAEEVAAYLAGKQDVQRARALSQLAWAMLTSTEFCVNH